jgi:Cu(I)/Ag(I) efflux system membrane fusion protein
LLSFSALPKKKYNGSIDFINPVLDPKTRTLKVRTTIENSEGLLKPGMVADAVLTVESEGLPLVVPRTAIIDTGKNKLFGSRYLQENIKQF